MFHFTFIRPPPHPVPKRPHGTFTIANDVLGLPHRGNKSCGAGGWGQRDHGGIDDTVGGITKAIRDMRAVVILVGMDDAPFFSYEGRLRDHAFGSGYFDVVAE